MEEDQIKMEEEQIKTKKPKTFKWYLDKILMVPVALLAIFGVLTMLAAMDTDDGDLILLGCLILLLVGLLASPNIILYAIKDSKDWRRKSFQYKLEESFEDRIFKEDFFYMLKDPSPYHDKLFSGVIREAILNFGGLFILIGLVLVGFISTFLNGFASDSYKAFAYILVVLVCVIPALIYNLTCSLCRIRAVRRREYFACHAVVSGIENFEMVITGVNGDEYRFNYCRCLGIRAKEIHNTKVILLFVPDEVYLIPVNQSY